MDNGAPSVRRLACPEGLGSSGRLTGRCWASWSAEPSSPALGCGNSPAFKSCGEDESRGQRVFAAKPHLPPCSGLLLRVGCTNAVMGAAVLSQSVLPAAAAWRAGRRSVAVAARREETPSLCTGLFSHSSC